MERVVEGRIWSLKGGGEATGFALLWLQSVCVCVCVVGVCGFVEGVWLPCLLGRSVGVP
jgi:hypothetical protein